MSAGYSDMRDAWSAYAVRDEQRTNTLRCNLVFAIIRDSSAIPRDGRIALAPCHRRSRRLSSREGDGEQGADEAAKGSHVAQSLLALLC